MRFFTVSLLIIATIAILLTAVACGETPATSTAGTSDVTTSENTTPTTPATTTPSTTVPVTTSAATTTPVTTTPITTTPETTVPETTTPTVSTGKKDPVSEPAKSVLNVNTAFSSQIFSASNNLSLPYRIYLPKDYSEEYAYPVMLFLHGAGERGTDNSAQLKNVIQKLYNDKSSPFYQCIVIVPQCPSENQWVDTPWANGNYRMDRIPMSKPLSAAVELLDYIVEEYSVNPDRQYVMGISMGGFGTWDLLMRYPERFAAAVPICGSADMTKGKDLVNIPIWTFHDTTDGTVPVSGTQVIVKAIEKAGGNLIKYTETSQYGHFVWDPAVETDGLFDWIFAQRKDKTE